MRYLLALCLLAIPASAVAAQRVEIPIEQVLSPTGRIAYTVTIGVGASPVVQAALDTGSTGLRLLPGAVGPNDVHASDEPSTYSYASGSKFLGTIGHASVSVGGLGTDGPIAVDLISAITCRDDYPGCPASRTDIASFGFNGDGVPGKGFKAIMGVDLRHADADNPLAEIGDGVWIVELPRPGDTSPGKLILNPAPDELAGFTRFHPAPQRTTIPGCLLDTDNSAKVCGEVLLDSGQPGLFVSGRMAPGSFPWPDGAHALLVMEDDRGAKIGAGLTINNAPGSPTALYYRRGPLPIDRIASRTPFFAYAVLFDSKAHEIGLKAR